MPVITISREFGSVGDDFGESIARALGYHCVCKEEIADLLDQYGMVEFSREYESRPGFWESFDSRRDKRRNDMVAMLNEVVQAVAQHGHVVIQGRSGFAILRDFADVLRVRVQAPLDVRGANIMEQEQLLREHAEGRVKVRDSVRRAFVEHFYNVPWGATEAFDMVINTGKISRDLALVWVVDAAKALALRLAASKPITRSIEVDSVLAKAVATALECQKAHS